MTTSFIRSAARRARSLASWAWAAVMLAAADPSACSAARLAWSAVIAARAARDGCGPRRAGLGGQQFPLAHHLPQVDPDAADPA